MKLFFKSFKFLLLLISLFIVYEVTSIDFKYINKDAISVDLNNVRNPQVKRLLRKADLYFGELYFNLSKKKQSEFYSQELEKYENSPDQIIVSPTTSNLTITNESSVNNDANWNRSHGNNLSNKFSNLKQVNTQNVHKLDVAWTHTFDSYSAVPGNPIFYNGVVYTASTNKSIVALNAFNGKKLWNYKTEGQPAIRGMLISDDEKSIIYFCDQVNLNAIYSSNGKPVEKFGKKGRVKLKKSARLHLLY